MTGKEMHDLATEVLIYLGTNYELTIYDAQGVLELAHDILEEAKHE